MGEKKASKSLGSLMMNMIILLLCACSMIFTVAKSEVILVGGQENRWTDGFNYVPWTQQYHFSVGDVLEFKYIQGVHNLYDVTKDTFQSCDTSTGVNAFYDTGDDKIELKEAKQYWFICTVDDHCKFGMKFTINVTDAMVSGTGVANPNPAPPSPPPMDDNNNAGIFTHVNQAASILSLVGGIMFIFM